MLPRLRKDPSETDRALLLAHGARGRQATRSEALR
jgi:hypothetical protein